MSAGVPATSLGCVENVALHDKPFAVWNDVEQIMLSMADGWGFKPWRRMGISRARFF
jgi:hypothetical protein